MDKLYNYAKAHYIKTLEDHIRLLKLDFIKHSATEEFYTELFDVVHFLWEQMEAIGEPVNSDTNCSTIMQNIAIREFELANFIKKAIKENSDIGMDNLLRDLYQTGQKRLAKIESLLKEEQENEKNEEDEENEETEDKGYENKKTIKIPK